jgi:hypothetical protein
MERLIPDYIDADPLNLAINTECSLQLDNSYKGVNEAVVLNAWTGIRGTMARLHYIAGV